ncbi:class I SAM-dependent methyltransferase [Deinococcus fonticola]|uniref:class I SAM-dependent methyltransferase n=1 Tax=Deinococcus fonticola TaxID=2528713 RepID=UPI001074FAAB|nr:class I SAM-dependent methyltransferase [Deinococcus fonticola]
MAHWAHSFYELQQQLTGCYSAPVHPFHYECVQQIQEAVPAGSLLELGAGGGQFAVAAARAFQVTALELRPSGTAHTLKLAAEHSVTLEAVTGDFYTVPLPRAFDVVCYWDGFGIDDDAGQQHLLRRVHDWLTPTGTAFIEVFSPWYWSKYAGYSREWTTPQPSRQTYGFDAEGNRMTDTYAPDGQPARTQTLRCYSPADFLLLLNGTGLTLTKARPGGHYDPDAQVWTPAVPLSECMTWTAVLKRS